MRPATETGFKGATTLEGKINFDHFSVYPICYMSEPSRKRSRPQTVKQLIKQDLDVRLKDCLERFRECLKDAKLIAKEAEEVGEQGIASRLFSGLKSVGKGILNFLQSPTGQKLVATGVSGLSKLAGL